MGNNKKVYVCVEIKMETEKAFGVTDGGELMWLPKSQITLLEDGGPGDTVEMEIPEWLAIKKGLV